MLEGWWRWRSVLIDGGVGEGEGWLGAGRSTDIPSLRELLLEENFDSKLLKGCNAATPADFFLVLDLPPLTSDGWREDCSLERAIPTW